jgi:hypothetical protein
MSQLPVDFVGKSSLKAAIRTEFSRATVLACSVPRGRTPYPRRFAVPTLRGKQKGKGRPDVAEQPCVYAGNYLLSQTLPNYFTRIAIPVASFGLLIKDMPCRAITCPTARGAGCTRMEKLELLVVPLGVISMTPLPLLCVV